MTNDRISTELQATIVGEAAPTEHRARAAGNDLDATEPRAVKAWYAADTERVFIELNTGIVMGFPYGLLQGLNDATSK